MTDAPPIPTKTAVEKPGALAQETRLKVVRALVGAGPEGMSAGDIRKTVGGSATALSFHLKELAGAGLVTSRRDGRRIVYTMAFEAMGALLDYLMDDCCQGRPEICGYARGGLSCMSTD